MTKKTGFSAKIIRVYLFGTSILFAFYMTVFHIGTMMTENALMERRINMVVPFHFQRFLRGEKGKIEVDPLLTIYDAYGLLTPHIRNKVDPLWTGSMQVLLDNEQEYQVVAQHIYINGRKKTVYAVEDTHAVEWNDTRLVLIELVIGLVCLILFVLTALYMTRAAKRIASPFLSIAQTLTSDQPDNFAKIEPQGEHSIELTQIVKAINAYRSSLALHLKKEKSFTRYVSHELRTPMTIIKGVVSNIRQKHPNADHRYLDKIAKATKQMEELTQIFLLLARDKDLHDEVTEVDNLFIENLCAELAHTLHANKINFEWHLLHSFTLFCHPLLLKAVLLNLLKNAFASSIKGNVVLKLNEKCLQLIDDGVGLDTQPISHDGFGIGLVLVQDICSKYAWRFELNDNENGGCTAQLWF